MSKSYAVFEYNKNTLCSYIANVTETQYSLVFQKNQITYLDNYLNHFLGKDNRKLISIVCENSYIDKGYMDDYVSFYSRCYSKYGQTCSRIHFFLYEIKCIDTEEFKNATEKEKEELIKNEKKEKCISSDDAIKNALLKKIDNTVISQDNYLGFLVIRPIPSTFIAKLCLKPYEEVEHNLLSRDYEISLFGIDLKVKTIAFQEQDRVVSACATSALWSMYHAHSDFPLKNIPSASSITKSAVEKYGIDMSDGLNSEMIIQQIKVNKLKPACISLEKDKNFVELKVIIKILIDSGLPLILGVEVFNENSDEKKGKHALTVLGYEEKDNEIVAIFVHDDRYGPYARMNFDNNKLKVLLNNEPVSETETYKPLMLIYAFYPKVHIPVKFLEDTRDSLLDDLKSFYSKDNIPDKNNFKFFNETTELLSKEMKWSIRLVNIKELRHLLFTINPENERVSYLVQGYPKYVWIIEGCYEENIIYFLFDATDIIQGNNFISIIYNSEETKNIFDDYFAYYFSSYLFNRTSKETLFHLPKNAIGEIAKKFKSKNSYDDFLDETFGICHFPNKIKDSEIKDSDLINSLTLRTVYEKTDYFKMDEKIYESSNKKYIWVIDKEGFFCCTLENISGIGHPTLTNGEPGRIGGEIFCKGGVWHINPFSGRYSKEYTPEEKNKFVMNVIKYRLNNIFPDINFEQEKA